MPCVIVAAGPRGSEVEGNLKRRGSLQHVTEARAMSSSVARNAMDVRRGRPHDVDGDRDDVTAAGTATAAAAAVPGPLLLPQPQVTRARAVGGSIVITSLATVARPRRCSLVTGVAAGARPEAEHTCFPLRPGAQLRSSTPKRSRASAAATSVNACASTAAFVMSVRRRLRPRPHGRCQQRRTHATSATIAQTERGCGASAHRHSPTRAPTSRRRILVQQAQARGPPSF